MKPSELKTQAEFVDEQTADPAFRDGWDRTALARAVAGRVVAYRTEHGLTQTALARQLRMQQPAVARLESGDHTPSLDVLWRLAPRVGLEFHLDITARGVAIQPLAGSRGRRGARRRRRVHPHRVGVGDHPASRGRTQATKRQNGWPAGSA